MIIHRWSQATAILLLPKKWNVEEGRNCDHCENKKCEDIGDKIARKLAWDLLNKMCVVEKKPIFGKHLCQSAAVEKRCPLLRKEGETGRVARYWNSSGCCVLAIAAETKDAFLTDKSLLPEGTRMLQESGLLRSSRSSVVSD